MGIIIILKMKNFLDARFNNRFNYNRADYFISKEKNYSQNKIINKCIKIFL